MKGSGGNINIITLAAIGLLFCLAATPLLSAKKMKNHLIASYYKEPYVPSACFGNEPLDPNQFLISLGDELWDNGRACGGIYDVTCIYEPGNQCQGQEGGSLTARGKVVDRCRDCRGVALLLSEDAFSTIAKIDGDGRVRVSFEKVN